MVTGTTDSRRELSRLILDGLAGRTQAKVWKLLQKALAEHGDAVTWQTFSNWIKGRSFPSTWARQLILADVIGGPCGEAIRKLQAPPFRGYRKRIRDQQEKEMTRMFKPHSGRNARQFPMVSRTTEDGKFTKQARITCTDCGRTYHHLRRGEVESEDYFRNKGWEVGNSSSHDYCPDCVIAKKKVVKMEDHVKNNTEKSDPAPAVAEPVVAVMTKEDGRLISRFIEERWDENLQRYKPGWSDSKLAEELGKPVDWVKARRELDFGGFGEDPTIAAFVQDQVAANMEMEVLKKMLGELEGSISAFAAEFERNLRALEKYRDRHNALSAKVQRLNEVAEKLPAPFDRKAG